MIPDSRYLLVVTAWLTLLGGVAGASEPDFTQDVRPILAQHCLKCHGPDDQARKAKLRLDLRDGALARVASGDFAIVPGHTDKGTLLQRIYSDDSDEVMPPPATKNPLTDAQKQTLKDWIAAGAKYKEHWAFIAPAQSPLPDVKQTDWSKNPIDRFILARIEEQGLRPSPPADKITLIRRVSLDLIGLPPTPEEVDAFVNDSAPDAYDKLVDRLLSSPHYGERWARRWLDLARYSDTNGYEKDRVRSIWPYRDWVINAFNADMPFDEFTIEQLAGDMLPNATPQQRIATGFHRNTMINEEGGIDPMEFRWKAVIDRNNVTATTWLGLTLGCAQCHTHKFDPITQREYYQMFAFFNNCDEPVMHIPDPAIEARQKQIQAQIARLEAELPDQFPLPEQKSAATPAATALPATTQPAIGQLASTSAMQSTPTGEVQQRRHAALIQAYNRWMHTASAKAVAWTVLVPTQMKANAASLHLMDDHSVFVTGDQTKRDVYDLTFANSLKNITAIRLEAIPDPRLPGGGSGRVYYEGSPGSFFLSNFAVSVAGSAQTMNKAVETFFADKDRAAGAIDNDPLTGWSVRGKQTEPQIAIFSFAKPIASADALAIELVFEKYFSAPMGRFRISVTSDPSPMVAPAVPADVEAELLVPPESRSSDQNNRLMRYFLSVAPELAKENDKIRSLQKSIPEAPTTLVLQERPSDGIRPTFIHHRGEYLQPTEQVQPNTVAFLPPMPAGVKHDRLGLAHWLVDPKNPLVARVTVNRQWAAFFGTGIVGTVGDFGYQGDSPTNQPLLDWLAVEFIHRGWSFKALDRLIVTSATYQQSSVVTPELMEKDPLNRLLARAPRVRLEAEEVRDYALAVSGVLSSKIGGPSVFPPQQPSVTTEGTYGPLTWNVSHGEDRYRRGLYTFSKRTAPYAMFIAFDAPSGEACVARRDVSDTPLQALTLLNDQVFTETSRALGKLVSAKVGNNDAKIDYLFRRCLMRPPTPDERDLLANFYATQLERFENHDLSTADIAEDKTATPTQAAWIVTARAMLNLDEMVTKN